MRLPSYWLSSSPNLGISNIFSTDLESFSMHVLFRLLHTHTKTNKQNWQLFLSKTSKCILFGFNFSFVNLCLSFCFLFFSLFSFSLTPPQHRIGMRSNKIKTESKRVLIHLSSYLIYPVKGIERIATLNGYDQQVCSFWNEYFNKRVLLPSSILKL